MINGDYGVAIAYCSVLIVLMLAVIWLIQRLVGERRLGRRDSAQRRPRHNWAGPRHDHARHRMKAASIEFRNVSKRYGDVAAVGDISFTDRARATLVTLLGPSGCGKTTTLRMIAGLELPSAGTILHRRRATSPAFRAAERDVSMVFQSYALFPHMSVLENVSYGLTRARACRRPRSASGRAPRWRPSGLTGFDARLPSELSGGQQQRVAVARALVLEPAVLLFDEPLSNLDARLRRQMREEIRELQQRLGLTVVYVTHDQSEAMAVSDRIIVMNKATIAQEGAPRELYEQPSDVFVAGFMGDANRVRGTLTRRDARLGDARARPADAHAAASRPLRRRGRRRDPARGDRAAEADAAPPGALPGTVRKAAYLGGLMEYTIDTGHRRAVRRRHGGRPPARGRHRGRAHARQSRRRPDRRRRMTRAELAARGELRAVARARSRRARPPLLSARTRRTRRRPRARRTG